MFDEIIHIILDNFDVSYCIAVNVATYVAIRLIDELNGTKNVSTWQKRIVLLIAICVISGIYYSIGVSLKLIINSSILAPVSWSWIFKPICKKLGIDYKKIDTVGE